MKTCIIGGSGNIGSAVTQELLRMGYDVTVVCRLQPDLDVECIAIDRRDREQFERLLGNRPFDVVIDCACFDAEDAASSVRTFRDIGHFFFVSSVCAYGTGYQWKDMPLRENCVLLPTTAYGRGKAEAERIFMRAYRESDFPVTIIRPSTTHGPRQGLFRQIGKDFSWLDRIAKGKPIAVCNNGEIHHQFMHVCDLARLIEVLLHMPDRTIGEAYNAVGSVTTWAEYHRAAMRVIGREVELVSVSPAALRRLGMPEFGIYDTIFGFESFFFREKLEGLFPAGAFPIASKTDLYDDIADIYYAMLAEERIPNSDHIGWEDAILKRTV